MISGKAPMPSELMMKYPFTPQSRQLFEKLPIFESFSSDEVQRQAEGRLLASLGRTRYEPHTSELIEFASFFVSALVASQDAFLTRRVAAREAENAKVFFAKESYENKPAIFDLCFDLKLRPDGEEQQLGVEEYLQFETKLELGKSPRWQLVNQSLVGGTIGFGENDVNDLFGDAAWKVIQEGIRNLRKAPFPKELLGLREKVVKFVPPQRSKSTRGYLYVEELLRNPVSDGRHRLVWLVLAPYLVNVKKLEDEEALGIIKNFVAKTGESVSMNRFIQYNIKRARRMGLMPPTIGKLQSDHADLFSLLPKAITAPPVPGLRRA